MRSIRIWTRTDTPGEPIRLRLTEVWLNGTTEHVSISAIGVHIGDVLVCVGQLPEETQTFEYVNRD